MKSSIRLIVVSVVIWFGLGAGSANAKIDTLSFVDNGASFNAFFGNDSITGAFSDTFNFTFPSGSIGTGGTIVVSGLDFNGAEVFFDNFELFNVTDTASEFSTTVVNTSSFFTFSGLDINDSYALIVEGGLFPGQTSGGYSGNLSISPVPEPETYAMLLIGLGLVAFTARRRRKYDFSY